jgi:tight adherence protein B
MIYGLLSLIIGVSAAVFVWAIFLLEKDLSPSTLKRLDRIKRKTNVITEQEDDDEDEIELAEKSTDYKIPLFGIIIDKLNISKKIKHLIKMADSGLYIDTFLFLSVICGIPFLLTLFTSYFLLSVLTVPAMLLPTFYLYQKTKKRFLEFSKQFPDALNLMASSLRAGHPLFSAIDIVTDEMPKPLCDVFLNVKKDLSLGIDTKDAFYNMTKLMPESIDLRFFITAVLIQKEVGGNLAELLDSLSATIRERFKLQGQLRVQTAQTRISGVVLGLVPLGVLIIIYFMNPEYIKPLFETTDGQIALAIAITLMITGMVSIKKISNIEI